MSFLTPNIDTAKRVEVAEFIVRLHARYSELDDSAIAIAPDISELAPPSGISINLAADCHRVARTLVSALRNNYSVDWDASEYVSQLKKTCTTTREREDSLTRQYKPLVPEELVLNRSQPLPIVSGPAVFTDCKGHIMAVSLPSLLPARLQATVFNSAKLLERQLKIDKPAGDQEKYTNWRRSAKYYTPGKDVKSGQVIMGPAWFELGWESKGPIVLCNTKTPEAIVWMKEMQEVGALVDGVLAVLHPELFRAVRERHATLHTLDAASRMFVDSWPSFYHAAQVIVNREAIMHRDISSLAGWLDALLSVGNYGQQAVFSMGTLGASVPYDSGSLVMVSSRAVLHGVPAVPPDRICVAWLLKDGIIPKPRRGNLPGWATLPTPSP